MTRNWNGRTGASRVSPYVGRELARLYPDRWYYDEANGLLHERTGSPLVPAQSGPTVD